MDGKHGPCDEVRNPMTDGIEARRLLRHCRSGALATLSKRLNGHPYASVVPFMSDYDGSPVLLISRLAEHTKNIQADSRVSLVVHEPSADVQRAERLTVIGNCVRINCEAALRERYVRLFPEAGDLLALDFDFHRITLSTVRYIGGFGKIHWVDASAFLYAGGIDGSVERVWLDRSDQTHRSHRTFVSGESVRAVALDCDGIDVRSDDDRITRIAFDRSAATPADLPEALRKLFQQATP